MPYIIRKHITVKKKNPFRIVTDILLLIIAVPVVIIAGISLCLVLIFTRLRSMMASKKPAADNNDLYYLELELTRNPHVQITLTDDERDTELAALNQEWAERIYSKETCLYRAGTVPQIPGVDGMICCFYCKEQPNGIILQVLKKPSEMPDDLDTQLMFIHYPDLKISILDNIGPYFLYNDEKNNHVIRGFNEKEKIVIELFPTPQISKKI